MKMMKTIRGTLALCLCAAVVTGCGSTGRGGGPIGGDELLTPGQLDQLDGDYGLDERFVDGARVSDVVFERINFEYDSFQISDSEVPKIRQVADYMNRNPNTRLVVEGHCDERGSRVYNMSLGEHRALGVRAYLIMLGIDSSRVQTRSYGEEMPLDASHTPSAYDLNRRGEFVLFR